MSLVETKFQEKFEEIAKMDYQGQAKWYLNAFWKEFAEAEAEHIWTFAHRMAQMDKKKGKSGNCIDEFEAHKFLESFGETLTVVELRERLRKIDVNNDKQMALVEFLLFHFPQSTIEKLCDSIQREDDPELIEAERLVKEASSAFEKATENAESARQAKVEADAKEEAAQKSAESAKLDFDVAAEKAAIADKAKKDAEAVEDELKAALAELKKQEDDLAAKIHELESIAGTPGVKGGQAAAQLLALKNENPLPLRKAQAEQAVVVRKAEKVRKAAGDAADIAKAAADSAEASANAAKQAADEAAASAQAAADRATEAEQSAVAAEQALEAAKTNVAVCKAKTSSRGTIWWMEREMIEMAKFQAPKKKNQ